MSAIHSPDVADLEIFGLERAWLADRSNVSCIPAGVYSLIPWESPAHGAVWAFVGGSVTPFKDDVPTRAGRWGCLIHPANYPRQLNGCLAPGMRRGEQDGELAVWSSRDALGTFNRLMGYEPLVAYVNWKV